MSPDEIKKWLKKEEYKTYKETEYNPGNLPTFWGKVRSVFESLASARAKSAERLVMLDKHEWSDGFCRECHRHHTDGHVPDCKWARAMKEGE